jgi:hypothetical protein
MGCVGGFSGSFRQTGWVVVMMVVVVCRFSPLARRIELERMMAPREYRFDARKHRLPITLGGLLSMHFVFVHESWWLDSRSGSSFITNTRVRIDFVDGMLGLFLEDMRILGSEGMVDLTFTALRFRSKMKATGGSFSLLGSHGLLLLSGRLLLLLEDELVDVSVVSVLDGILGSSRNKSGDLSPFRSNLLHVVKDFLVFGLSEGFMVDGWVKLVLPPFSTLFAATSAHFV